MDKACLSLLLFLWGWFAHALSPLTGPPEGELLKQLEEKGFILNTLAKKKDQVWPEIEVWAFIEAPALVSVAIFAAYDYQKEYIPNLIKSEVVGQPSPTEVHVSYELDLTWPIPNQLYTHGHHFSSPEKDHYLVRWFMVKSNSMKAVDGFAYFRPYQLGDRQGTLMTYRSLAEPQSSWVGILGRFMVKDVERSLRTTVTTIENLHAKKNPLVERYTIKIRRALNGQKAY